jgi:hypothetical protein
MSAPNPPGPYPGPNPGAPRWVPPTPRTGGGSLLLGLLVGVVTLTGGPFLLAALIGLVPQGWSNDTLVPLLFGGSGLAYLIVAISLAAQPATSRLGAGLLLAIGASILIGAGICFTLLATWSP